jgi:hypothetical protein
MLLACCRRLHSCAPAGNAEQLQQLLAEEGCDVNQADEEGRTALHFAGDGQQGHTQSYMHACSVLSGFGWVDVGLNEACAWGREVVVVAAVMCRHAQYALCWCRASGTHLPALR